MADKKVAETKLFPSQLSEVASAMALPLVAAGNTSLSSTHVTGPKLKEYAHTKETRARKATML